MPFKNLAISIKNLKECMQDASLAKAHNEHCNNQEKKLLSRTDSKVEELRNSISQMKESQKNKQTNNLGLK